MVMIMSIPSLAELISLRGKRTLITGAAAGIGRAIALRFAEADSDLVLVDINTEGLKQVKQEIKEKYGVDTEIYRVDLAVKKEIDNLWRQLEGREPDILVNNAGIYLFRDFLEVDEDLLEKTLAINLKAVFLDVPAHDQE